jgi:hypothetical protein
MLKKLMKILAGALAMLLLAFAGFVWWSLQPRPEPRPLPDGLVAVSADRGQALLARASAAADYGPLAKHFEPQSLKSYCGVASGVAVLSAIGLDVDQGSFFNSEAEQIRPRIAVMLGGMSLGQLAGLLRAHGAIVNVHHADEFTVEEFRDAVATNLDDKRDYLVVNYQREVLGQPRVGHISPLAAYDAESDLVLVMDTASHYYPHTWVPLEKLYAAMATTDPSSGQQRGYLRVTGDDDW